jgi:hypothetical protein
MEGWGIRQIVLELKNLGFRVRKLTHDQDASTLKSIIHILEDIQECLDPGHCCKNFRKKLEKSKFPELRSIALRASFSLRQSFIEAAGMPGMLK